MARILSISLNPAIDVSSEAETVRTTHKVRTSNQSFDPGGGGVNVARVITELGGDVELLYLAGGFTGVLLDELVRQSVGRCHRIAISGNTRISFTVQERQTGLEYRFVASGPTVGGAELAACLAAIRDSEFDYLVASGSLPAGAPDDYLAEVAKTVVSKNARFVLDSSGPGLKTTLALSRAFLLKPNLDELEDLVGHRLDGKTAKVAAVDLVRRGKADIVALTMGAAGVILATRDRVIEVPALKVTVRSSVGAGDSFLGALTLAVSDGRDAEDALAFGLAAGAAALLRPGTRLCSHEAVHRLHDEARRMVHQAAMAG
jgi:6-phosphofructokinase 2